MKRNGRKDGSCGSSPDARDSDKRMADLKVHKSTFVCLRCACLEMLCMGHPQGARV